MRKRQNQDKIGIVLLEYSKEQYFSLVKLHKYASKGNAIQLLLCFSAIILALKALQGNSII